MLDNRALLRWLIALSAAGVCAAVLWGVLHQFGTFLFPAPPQPEADEFRLIQLSGNVAKDQEALNAAAHAAFEYVTSTTPPGNNQTILVFRKGQLSNFQRHILAVNIGGYHLNLFWVSVSILGLVGLYGTFASIRTSIYSQVYQRYQTITLRLMDHPITFHLLFADISANPDEASESGLVGGALAAAPLSKEDQARTLMVTQAVLSLFEEVYLLRHTTLVPLLPRRVWQFWEKAIQQAMARPHFQQYLDLHRERYDEGFREWCRRHRQRGAGEPSYG